MRPHRTCSIIQPSTHTYLNDYLDKTLSETLPGLPTHPTPRLPLAMVVLIASLALAIVVMLGTWLSRSTPATDRVTTFVAYPEEPPLVTDELGDNLPPAFLDDIFTLF